jgi:hypothetical protein
LNQCKNKIEGQLILRKFKIYFHQEEEAKRSISLKSQDFHNKQIISNNLSVGKITNKLLFRILSTYQKTSNNIIMRSWIKSI